MDSSYSAESSSGTMQESTPPLLPRRPLSLGVPLSPDAFSICSFNILCETYCRADVYLPKLCEPKYLKWDYRRDLVLGEILRTSPDVICLQEVELEVFRSFLEPTLRPLNYLGVYRQKMCKIPGEAGRPDGVAIFFKSTRFVLEAHYEVDLESNEYGVTTDWPQCAQIASLRLVTSVSKRIIVANTHLKANETVVDERIRNAQAAILLDQIKNFVITYRLGQPPILICGDFNSRPASTVYKLFVQGAIHAEVGYLPNHFKHLTHPFRLSSAYRHLHLLRSVANGVAPESVSPAERPTEAPFTMRMPGWTVTYDYVFYSQEWLRVVQLLDIPDEQTWPEKCLPAWNFGSDHLSLVAWFDWLQDCIYN